MSCTIMRKSAITAGRKKDQLRMTLLCSRSRSMSRGHRPRTATMMRSAFTYTAQRRTRLIMNISAR